jgi:GxxExxY protein
LRISAHLCGKIRKVGTTKSQRRHNAHKENNYLLENKIASKVIGLAIDVHRVLGPGLLESTYKECLYYKINKSGYFVEREKNIPLIFENTKLDCGYRIDLLVENKLVIELKSVDMLNDVHLAQVLTYLRLGNFRLGLLINFNVSLLKKGIKRIIN